MLHQKQHQKDRLKCPLTCVACGSVATGYNYGAPSCASCKAFFYRTMTTGRLYPSCRKDGGCAKDESIRLCRVCRLERCLEGGMTPSLIMNLNSQETQPTGLRGLIKQCSSEEVRPSSESTMEQILDELLHLETLLNDLRGCPDLYPGPNECSLDNLIERRSMLSGKAQHRYENVAVPSNAEANVQLCQFTDLLLSIEYVKTFEFFRFLTKHEKKLLCRHVAIMCSHLTTAFLSYENSGVSTLPHGFVQRDGYKSDEVPHVEELFHLIRQIDMDKKEYVLLKALIVCNPVIEGLSTSHKVKLEMDQVMYSRLLTRLLISRHGQQRGPMTCAAIVSMFDHMTHLMKKEKNSNTLRQALYSNRNEPSERSLFNEIYDH